jgi:pimeloyl-ACP methyl ester carboxylesterase
MIVRYNHSELYYIKSGGGPDNLLLFHGFGQDHSAFLLLSAALEQRYTCYIFDLYHHGESKWHHDEALSKKDWEAIMTTFMENENIQRFSLLGFSMGAKLVLATLELFSDRTEQIFLIAPDGIKRHILYTVATSPFLLQRAFKAFMKNPTWLITTGQRLQRLKLINGNLMRFVIFHLHDEKKRERVYQAWMLFRKLSFNTDKLAASINTHAITTTMILAKHDEVIASQPIIKFASKLKKCRLEVLDTGHAGLIRHATPYILNS